MSARCPACGAGVEHVAAGVVEETVITPWTFALARRARPASYYCCMTCDWCGFVAAVAKEER